MYPRPQNPAKFPWGWALGICGACTSLVHAAACLQGPVSIAKSTQELVCVLWIRLVCLAVWASQVLTGVKLWLLRLGRAPAATSEWLRVGSLALSNTPDGAIVMGEVL